MPPGPGGDRFGRVHVRLNDRVWVLRDASALDWIMGAQDSALAGIYPGLVEDHDVREIFRALVHGTDMPARCTRVARVALERAGRREWTWTYNLIQECLGSWTIVNGMLIRQGIRADNETLANWLDAAYTLIRELIHEEKALTAFETRLKSIPRDALGTMTPKMSSRAALLEFAAP